MNRPQANRAIRAVCIGFLCLASPAWMHAQTQPGAGRVCPDPGFNPQPWLDDFEQLIVEMSAHYADLEYAVEAPHMDLPRLRAETETKLKASCEEGEAKQALQSFVKSFGDGHLDIEWPNPPAKVRGAAAETQSPCRSLSYETPTLNPGIDFSQLPQFTSVGGDRTDWFPSGILTVNANQKLGVIRIPVFGERWFPDACEQAFRDLHLTDTRCDQGCKNKLQHATGNLLTAILMKRTAELQSAGASAIVVDITRNDGGSDWVDPVVRSFSPIPLRESPWGFIKHEHWTKELEQRLSQVESDLKSGKEPKQTLEEAAARLQSAVALSEEKCDRSSVWTSGKLTCSLVVSGVLYSSGVLPYAAPGSFAALQSRGVLFRPFDYAYTESSARPPLYVVVDSHTWSSAEYFAFLLQDNGAATILGEVTGGAGCGFTNGGIPTVLKNSRAQVKMPDCVHFRKDGSNANAGVTPDVLVPWSVHDSPYLRAQKLYRALVTAVTAEPKEASCKAHE